MTFFYYPVLKSDKFIVLLRRCLKHGIWHKELEYIITTMVIHHTFSFYSHVKMHEVRKMHSMLAVIISLDETTNAMRNIPCVRTLIIWYSQNLIVKMAAELRRETTRHCMKAEQRSRGGLNMITISLLYQLLVILLFPTKKNYNKGRLSCSCA